MSNVQQDDMAGVHNMSVRNEDLSVIDDEMPIQNKINKNLKPEQIQGLIDQIQPEIYKGLTQSLSKNDNSARVSQSNQLNNNIFINMCSFNNQPKTERLSNYQPNFHSQ